MALIPEVKCSRCDRRYSGLRSRCPYCGARRSRKGKRVSSSDNSVWKLVIGILLLVVLIAAVVVLLVTTLRGGKGGGSSSSAKSSVSMSENEGVSTLESSKPASSSAASGSSAASSSSAPSVESVRIDDTYATNATDVTLKVTEVLDFSVTTVPAETGKTPEWKSSDENVFVVLQTGKVTAVGTGTATLTVTVGGVSAECIIRVQSGG